MGGQALRLAEVYTGWYFLNPSVVNRRLRPLLARKLSRLLFVPKLSIYIFELLHYILFNSVVFAERCFCQWYLLY